MILKFLNWHELADYLKEVGVLVIPHDDHPMNLTLQLHFFIFVVVDVPLG